MSAGFAEAFAEIFARPEDRVGPRIRAWRRRRNGMSQQVGSSVGSGLRQLELNIMR
jgi:hypothetical protein